MTISIKTKSLNQKLSLSKQNIKSKSMKNQKLLKVDMEELYKNDERILLHLNLLNHQKKKKYQKNK